MLRALAKAADQVKYSETASADPPRISNQIDENWAVAEGLEKRKDPYVAIKLAANDITRKARTHVTPNKVLERARCHHGQVERPEVYSD